MQATPKIKSRPRLAFSALLAISPTAHREGDFVHPRRSPATASNLLAMKRCNCVRDNFSMNPTYASCGDVLARQWRTGGARRASHFTVARHALLAPRVAGQRGHRGREHRPT